MDVAADVSLISIVPHCHLIGVSGTCSPSPNNQDTILISIPSWDFNAGIFTFPSLTNSLRIHPTHRFVTTRVPIIQPQQPAAECDVWRRTTDEMFFVFFVRPLKKETSKFPSSQQIPHVRKI